MSRPALPFLAAEADRLSLLFAQIASEAGVAVMEVFRAGTQGRTKADHSPVSDADERAEAIILERLSRDLPGVPVLAEEAAARDGVDARLGDTFLLVDPVDGTREFLSGGSDFTVNIALVHSGEPVAGCVTAPARNAIWFGGASARASDAFSPGERPDSQTGRPIATRVRPERPVVLVSSSHLDPDTRTFVEQLGTIERRSIGSSLKFCLLAEGAGDIYPRWGPTMEWDTAAGHAVLNAAGGCVYSPAGDRFLYGKAAQDYRNGPFIAWGRRPG